MICINVSKSAPSCMRGNHYSFPFFSMAKIWDLYLSFFKDLLNLLVVRIQFLRREREIIVIHVTIGLSLHSLSLSVAVVLE